MISIIICTYNRDCYIEKTLQNIVDCKADKSDYEIVLIDNNSTDNTSKICHNFEERWKNKINYHYVIETKQGLSNARNRGIEESNGNFLVFLDDDAFIASNYIENLKNHLSNNPMLAAFGGKIDPFYETGIEPNWMSKWSYSWVSAIDYGNKVRPFKGKAYPIGANMGVRKDLAKEVGGFNPNLGRKGKNTMGGEEKDFFNKIKARGKVILYFPNVCVQHCIPNQRLTLDFIAKLGKGVGISEKQRTIDTSKFAYLSRLCMEIVKWIGTIVLLGYFSMCGCVAKGKVLVLFRWNVSKGLL